MIVPMKKIWVLCLERERGAALENLASLGVVQVEETTAESMPVQTAASNLAAAQCAAAALAEAAAHDDPYSLALRRAPAGAAHGDAGARHVLDVAGRWLDAKAEAAELEAAVAKYGPWGSFDPESARRLAAAGVPYAARIEKAGHCQILARKPKTRPWLFENMRKYLERK